MKKYFPHLFLLILIGCTSKKALDNDLEKKQTFIKILGLIKTNQVDSIKKYMLFEDDTALFNWTTMNTIRNANMIMNTSNSIVSIDSIFIKDSSFVLTEKKSFYTYYLRFYKDKKYTGAIAMDFYDNLNSLLANIEYDVYVDEDSLVDEMYKSIKKNPKDVK